MENKQFTPCPACGAVGEVGNKCQFCGSTIIAKEGVVCTNSRVVKQRTVTPQQYAEKISIYHGVKGIGYGLTQVSIGDQKGIVNLNGDIILPLRSMGDSYFDAANDFVVKKKDCSAIFGDEITYGYINIKTFEEADKLGFIKDKNDGNKLYLINPKDWTIKNEYTNYNGIIKSFEYAEKLRLEYEDLFFKLLYLFHEKDTLSLCLEYKNDENLIILEGIKSIGKLKDIGNFLTLPIEMPNGKNFDLNIATKNIKRFNLRIKEEIYGEWLTAIGEYNPFEEERKKKRKVEEEKIKAKEEEKIKAKEEEKRKAKEKKKEKIRNLVIYSVICIVSFIITIVAIFLETNDKDSMLGIPLGMLGVIGLITSLSMLNNTY